MKIPTKRPEKVPVICEGCEETKLVAWNGIAAYTRAHALVCKAKRKKLL